MPDPDIKVRVALDSDPDDPAPVWTDITSRVHYGEGGQPVTVDIGRQDETAEIKPAELAWAVRNADNAFTPRNPASPYYGKWEQGRRCWITETVDGVEFDLGQGFLEIPDMPIVDPRSPQAVAVTAVDRMGRLDSAPTFEGTLAEHVRVQSSDLAVHFPLTDPYPHTSSNTLATTARVVSGFFDQPVAAEPPDLIRAADTAGPPGDDQSYARWDPVTDAAGAAFLARAHLEAPISAPVAAGEVVALSAWVHATGLAEAQAAVQPDATVAMVLDTAASTAIFLSDYKTGIQTTVYVAGVPSVVVVGSRRLERDVWRLVTVRWHTGTGAVNLWVGADLVASGTSAVPSAFTFSFLQLGSLFIGALGHVQIRVGPDATTMTYAMHLAQYAHGYRGLERQTVAERIETLAGYAGIPATEIGTLAAADPFDRTVAGDWGVEPLSGLPWITSGGSPSDFAVAGGSGRHIQSTVGVLRHSLIELGSTDVEVSVDFVNPAQPAGAPVSEWVVARVADTSNYYAASISISTGNVVTLNLLKRVGGGLTGLLGSVVPVGSTSSGQAWRVVLSVADSTLRAKAWRPALDPKPDWQATATDTALKTGTKGGPLSRLETGNTNTLPHTIFCDNFTARLIDTAASTPLQVARLAGVTPAKALRDAATAGQDVLITDGQGNLVLIPRGRRYNQPVSLQIPFGWIGRRGLKYRPDKPVTDVTVTRTGGGTARRTDPARARRYGVTGQRYDLDTAIDADPGNLASWALAAFGQQRTRCPSLRINMLRRTLAQRQQLLGLRVGDRIQLTGMPASSPEDVPHLIVQGVKHTIGPGRVRVIEFNTSPLLGPTPGVPPACPMVGDLVSTTAIIAY